LVRLSQAQASQHRHLLAIYCSPDTLLSTDSGASRSIPKSRIRFQKPRERPSEGWGGAPTSSYPAEIPLLVALRPAEPPAAPSHPPTGRPGLARRRFRRFPSFSRLDKSKKVAESRLAPPPRLKTSPRWPTFSLSDLFQLPTKQHHQHPTSRPPGPIHHNPTTLCSIS
jgi:hypothetical protein